MSLNDPPSIGQPIPIARHAVSVQIPTWQEMCDLPLGTGWVKHFQQIGYPRSFLHPSIQKVFRLLPLDIKLQDKWLMSFEVKQGLR